MAADRRQKPPAGRGSSVTTESFWCGEAQTRAEDVDSACWSDRQSSLASKSARSTPPLPCARVRRLVAASHWAQRHLKRSRQLLDARQSPKSFVIPLCCTTQLRLCSLSFGFQKGHKIHRPIWRRVVPETFHFPAYCRYWSSNRRRYRICTFLFLCLLVAGKGIKNCIFEFETSKMFFFQKIRVFFFVVFDKLPETCTHILW